MEIQHRINALADSGSIRYEEMTERGRIRYEELIGWDMDTVPATKIHIRIRSSLGAWHIRYILSDEELGQSMDFPSHERLIHYRKDAWKAWEQWYDKENTELAEA